MRENPRSWQEFQDILHWVSSIFFLLFIAIVKTGNRMEKWSESGYVNWALICDTTLSRSHNLVWRENVISPHANDFGCELSHILIAGTLSLSLSLSLS